MHLLTFLGTRPEIIKLSAVIRELAEAGIENTIVYTNQNATANLSTWFLDELGVKVDYFIEKLEKPGIGEWIGHLLKNTEEIIQKEKPDGFLILGDTYSVLSAIIAAHHNIPIIHMEAGNRSRDWRMPEEKNRKIIDHISNYSLPFVQSSKENLLQEGIPEESIFVSGDPIVEVIKYYEPKIDQSDILKKLNVEKGKFLLATIHRTENTNNLDALTNILRGLNLVVQHFDMPLIWGIHPRAQSKLASIDVKLDERIQVSDLFDFFDFVKLEKNAYMALSDSGTVHEECALFMVPTVILRETCERPETIECGSTMLSGTKDPNKILEAAKTMDEKPRNWVHPYASHTDVSKKVVNFIKCKF